MVPFFQMRIACGTADGCRDPLHPSPRGVIIDTGENMSEFILRIDGMHCGSCVRRVSQALAQAPGLQVKEVQIGAARVQSDENPPPMDRAIAALAAAGYKAHPDPSGA
jgi:copper chaperone CopZ